MIDTIFCKTCCRYRPKIGYIERIDAKGSKQARCAECVEKVKKATK